jgi:hypothetical protein
MRRTNTPGGRGSSLSFARGAGFIRCDCCCCCFFTHIHITAMIFFFTHGRNRDFIFKKRLYREDAVEAAIEAKIALDELLSGDGGKVGEQARKYFSHENAILKCFVFFQPRGAPRVWHRHRGRVRHFRLWLALCRRGGRRGGRAHAPCRLGGGRTTVCGISFYIGIVFFCGCFLFLIFY